MTWQIFALHHQNLHQCWIQNRHHLSHEMICIQKSSTPPAPMYSLLLIAFFNICSVGFWGTQLSQRSTASLTIIKFGSVPEYLAKSGQSSGSISSNSSSSSESSSS